MRKTLCILVALVALVGLFFLIRDNSSDVYDDLAKREARRESQREANAFAEQHDLAKLAARGLGQAVPIHLVSQIDPSGDFWFVGIESSELGVQIPFEPGKIPDPPAETEPVHENPGFLGADACQSCHQEKHQSFVKTAHHRTSRLATAENISGSFESVGNRMQTADENVHFTMIERDGKFYQRVSFFDWQFEVPFHLVMGSSKMGESYLYWHGDQLFQMNCTYLSEVDDWINSPGYLDGDAIYARPILTGCLECHVTYIDHRKPPNHFTPGSLITGISCERCHGPGKEHVDFHLANPNVKESKHVSVPSKLSREQQMDICGQCHTAQKSPKDPRGFQFRPGDRLADHYDPVEGHDTSANSVHTSNQVARLQLSECFKQSEMACAECHNPHKPERGQTALFSKRCMSCHESEHCGMSDTLGERLAQNCIDCHMPVRASENLKVDTAEGSIFPPLRDHFIRIDPQATEEYLGAIKGDVSK